MLRNAASEPHVQDLARFLVALFATDRPELLALIEADRLGQRRTGAASAVAAKAAERAAVSAATLQ